VKDWKAQESRKANLFISIKLMIFEWLQVYGLRRFFDFQAIPVRTLPNNRLKCNRIDSIA